MASLLATSTIAALLPPTNGNDYIVGTNGNDYINALGGNDTIEGTSGNDTIDGGAGYDTVNYEERIPYQRIILEPLGVVKKGIEVTDQLIGIERIIAGSNANNNLINASTATGFTRINVNLETGDLYVLGTPIGNLDPLKVINFDDVYGTNNNDTIVGDAQDNIVQSFGGNDYINTGSGNDRILAQNGSDTVEGGYGNDTVYGGYDSDLIYGGYGNDSLSGDNDNDTLDGGYGNDTLDGGYNFDSLTGGYGNDYLNGEYGNDYLNGGSGNDLLVGGTGPDTLTGGIGRDSFYFSSLSDGIDQITDFSVFDDKISVRNVNFGLSLGSISSSLFRIGSMANTSSQRFIYNSSTGALFFDPDGSGSIAQTQFATLSRGLALTSANFVVQNLFV